jgi:fructosamine-3-kinase
VIESGEFDDRLHCGRGAYGGHVQAASPLLDSAVVQEIERAASAHFGLKWATDGFTDLRDRASHPSGIFHGRPVSVFAKLSFAVDARGLFAAELKGLELLRIRAQVATPTLIGPGVVDIETGSLLLFEAVPERLPHERTPDDWRSIDHTLAALHQVHAEQFGLELFDGYFGPFPQDNRPVASGKWADFYAERRVLPRLRSAVDSGHLPSVVASEVERLVDRMSALCGPEPSPSLLHGDAQLNNFLSGAIGAVIIDAAPYFGHPEQDLALIDQFESVPASLIEAYQEVLTIDPEFADRRELWRIFSYLAIVEVEGESPFGQKFLRQLIEALHRYR